MRYFAFIFILLFSCTKSVDDDELSLNQKKWIGNNITNYEFTLTVNCFCLSARVGPHNIKVTDDKIVSVNNSPYDITKTGELMTINQLFEFIKTSIAKNPFRNTIEYNSTYGYPQNIYFDFNQQIADEEIGYQITNFKPN
jgi:hypothetical protein